MTGLMRPLVILAAALAFMAQAPASGAEPVQLAQAQEEDGYLPPWQDEEDGSAEEGDIGSRDGYDEPESLSPRARDRDYDRYEERESRRTRRHDERPRRYDDRPRHRYDDDEHYTSDEIIDAGHRFFGTVTEGLARVVEYAFSRQGYPNGYILGEEAGGAFVAGLRYGEGMLHTKHLGRHKVFWQGPSVGYDFGGDGSKTMILVYDIQHPAEMYQRFAGVDGSAYFVGGVGITFQRSGEVVLAPIRSGVGLRLGANVGYLKYTREPTWNPF
ncbi:MAG: DUF1134 domain-containing protein [Dichotomicrobium sp.]